MVENCFLWLPNSYNSFIIIMQNHVENSCVYITLTVSVSLNATTAGVTRSPESFAITSIFESYTKHTTKTVEGLYLYTKTIFSSTFRDNMCARMKHIHISPFRGSTVDHDHTQLLAPDSLNSTVSSINHTVQLVTLTRAWHSFLE